ncbi:LysM peptidoglycan-binding domain-containing protein [uncultured Roseobacter sp.]|uniref:LysM peptidoglycan-binding domain-containing protein n=1 Tax=uncultured Roseobacter sp. TaxID=114847 RepID=UPI0026264120|nr:LysM peptidoglycan-binding domain-containing protein [uncultured Roseobacter sp.]
MREDDAASKSGGTGLVTAGLVIAAVIAAGAYFGLRDQGPPSPEELAAIVASDAPDQPVAETPPAEPEKAAETPQEEAPAEEVSEPEVPDENDLAEEAEAAEPAEEEIVADTPEPIVPSVDEVRLEEDGLTVIAGRAAPGAKVSVLVDGVEVATAVADARGAFAAVGFIPASDVAQVLTLRADGQDVSVASVDEIILAPLPKPVAVAEAEDAQQDAPASNDAVVAEETDVAVPSVAQTSPEAPATDEVEVAEAPRELTEVVPETVAEAPEVAEPSTEDAARAEEIATPSEGTAAEPEAPASETLAQNAELKPPQTDVAEADAPPVQEPETAPVPAAETETAEVAAPQVATPEPTRPAESGAPAEPSQTVAVLKSTPEGVELLQPAEAPKTNIALDTIGYSETGDVQLSGRAVAGSVEVRVYLDNQNVAAFPVAEDGTWRGAISGVDAGIYTLRVDELNAEGDVTSRVETPFKREAPAVLAAATEGQTGPVTAVTVQTGDTLWAIARDRYGEGLLYVRVFEANRDAIRDPDLIYPGQIFDLPGE